MSLRISSKDHLAEHAGVTLAPTPIVEAPTLADPLMIWVTKGQSTHLFDVTSLRDGQAAHNGKWNGPYTGRPGLISQLLPALKDATVGMSQKSTQQVLTNLRGWWRLFDAVEADAVRAGLSMKSADDIAAISEIHRQRAFDQGMHRKMFAQLLAPLNVTRRALGLTVLHWDSPQRSSPARHLSPEWQVREIRRALRHRWFAVVDRWALADDLLGGTEPKNAEQARLLSNYTMYASAMKSTGKAYVELEDLIGTMTRDEFFVAHQMAVMRPGFYPDVTDICAAFNRCLAETGWNPSTLLDLNVEEPFIEPHPMDPTRYVMTGWKERSSSEQPHVGLWKTVGSPGSIVTTLIARTQPLRDQLKQDLVKLKRDYDHAVTSRLSTEKLTTMFQEVQRLESGLQSPWLFISRHGIKWLTKDRYNKIGTRPFLRMVIEDLNRALPQDRQIDSGFVPSDFRDAFAAYVWLQSGGSVLHVKKMLGHAALSSTVDYTDNVLLNNEAQNIFRNFGDALWHEITVHERLDPTLIAKAVRDGDVAVEDRKRLSDYRSMRRSRLGVACADPHHPPRRVAPTFEPDGQRMCNAHRCTLCYENAVIVPESLDGLCMRTEELLAVQKVIPATTWLASGYPQELANTIASLSGFDASDVALHRATWNRNIFEGRHKIIELLDNAGARDRDHA